MIIHHAWIISRSLAKVSCYLDPEVYGNVWKSSENLWYYVNNYYVCLFEFINYLILSIKSDFLIYSIFLMLMFHALIRDSIFL